MKMTPTKLLVIVALAVAGWMFREPLGQKWEELKGAGTRLSTWMEMNEYAEGMVAYLRENEQPGDFPRWLDARFDDDMSGGETRRPSVDRYGRQYRLTRDDQRRLVIQSCGPDTTCGTDDDIVVEVEVE